MNCMPHASSYQLRGRSYFLVLQGMGIPLELVVVVPARNMPPEMVVQLLIWFPGLGGRFLQMKLMGGLGLGGFLLRLGRRGLRRGRWRGGVEVLRGIKVGMAMVGVKVVDLVLFLLSLPFLTSN